MFKNNKKTTETCTSLEPLEYHSSMTTILENTPPLFAKAVGSPVLSLVHTPPSSLSKKKMKQQEA